MKKQKANKQVIIDFIVSHLENGEQRASILAKVGKRWQKEQISPRTFDRLLKTAHEQHKVKQDEIKEELAKVDKQAAIEARKMAIMSANERKEYLTKLIYGDIEIPYTEVKWNPATKSFETIKFVELASHTARIGAISELNKMEGDYAPVKNANTDSSGKDIPPPQTLTDDQFNKLLQAARETKADSSK